jgi:small redox-active disulfide protein 2
MKIKILGEGCSKCTKTEKSAIEAIKSLGIDAEVIKVQDIVEIMKYGVMTTPALVINDKVKASGRILSVEDIKRFIQEEK